MMQGNAMLEKMRIVLADDHPLVTAGLKHMLSQYSDFDVVAQARTPDALIEAIVEFQPHAVITDYNMPGPTRHGDGIKLVSYIRNNHSSVKVVVLTMISSAAIASSLYSLGVAGVLLKSDDLPELTKSIRSILLHKQRPRSKQPHLDRSEPVDDRVAQLTRKEMEILRYLFSGMSVSEIAAQLNRGISTVSSHKVAAMRKLGTENDHELIMFCVHHGLFTS